jgi:hypothetical protein
LTKEDLKRNKAMQQAFTDGNIAAMPADDEKVKFLNHYNNLLNFSIAKVCRRLRDQN